jgi:late competence protein required for DNA uptake (superfamily II DNA/RNA helicase)
MYIYMEYTQNKNWKGKIENKDKNLPQINFVHHCCRFAHDLPIVVAKYVWISAENYASRTERADRIFRSLRELS